MKNPFTKAYIQLLSYALNVLNEFNGLFQSKEVLIHKVYDLSHGLLRSPCINYMTDVYTWIALELSMSLILITWLVHNLHGIPFHFLAQLFWILLFRFQLPDDEIELGPGCKATLDSITPTPDNPDNWRRTKSSSDSGAFIFILPQHKRFRTGCLWRMKSSGICVFWIPRCYLVRARAPTLYKIWIFS